MPLIVVFCIGLIAEGVLLGGFANRFERHEPTRGVAIVLTFNTFLLVLELIGLLGGR